MHSFFLRFFGFELNPSKYGGGRGRVILARDRFKFKLFLNDSWYEPETLLLFVTFTKGYFSEKKKKIEKNIKFSAGNIFPYWGYCQKIGV